MASFLVWALPPSTQSMAALPDLGLTFISNFLVGQQAWVRLMGGVFLCYLGLKALLAKPAEHAALAKGNGLVGAYASTFFLTLTNPMTVICYTAIFAGLGLANTGGNYVSARLLVFGLFIGSSLWWIILSGGVGVFREKFHPRGLQWVKRISGAIITAFGLFALLTAL